MLRAMIVGTFWCMAFAQSRPEPEIVQAARSPYELARYVDTHLGFEWKAAVGDIWPCAGCTAAVSKTG